MEGEPTSLASMTVAMPTVRALVGTSLMSPPKNLALRRITSTDCDLTLVLDTRLEPVSLQPTSPLALIPTTGMSGRITTQRNATQRNATQRNATQRNATQRNATQRNATQRNATQCNATQYTKLPPYRPTCHEQMYASRLLDLRLVVSTLLVEVFGVAIHDVHVLSGDVDVLEEIVPHEIGCALRRILLESWNNWPTTVNF